MQFLVTQVENILLLSISSTANYNEPDALHVEVPTSPDYVEISIDFCYKNGPRQLRSLEKRRRQASPRKPWASWAHVRARGFKTFLFRLEEFSRSAFASVSFLQVVQGKRQSWLCQLVWIVLSAVLRLYKYSLYIWQCPKKKTTYGHGTLHNQWIPCDFGACSYTGCHSCCTKSPPWARLSLTAQRWQRDQFTKKNCTYTSLVWRIPQKLSAWHMDKQIDRSILMNQIRMRSRVDIPLLHRLCWPQAPKPTKMATYEHLWNVAVQEELARRPAQI